MIFERLLVPEEVALRRFIILSIERRFIIIENQMPLFGGRDLPPRPQQGCRQTKNRAIQNDINPNRHKINCRHTSPRQIWWP